MCEIYGQKPFLWLTGTAHLLRGLSPTQLYIDLRVIQVKWNSKIKGRIHHFNSIPIVPLLLWLGALGGAEFQQSYCCADTVLSEIRRRIFLLIESGQDEYIYVTTNLTPRDPSTCHRSNSYISKCAWLCFPQSNHRANCATYPLNNSGLPFKCTTHIRTTLASSSIGPPSKHISSYAHMKSITLFTTFLLLNHVSASSYCDNGEFNCDGYCCHVGVVCCDGSCCDKGEICLDKECRPDPSIKITPSILTGDATKVTKPPTGTNSDNTHTTGRKIPKPHTGDVSVSIPTGSLGLSTGVASAPGPGPTNSWKPGNGTVGNGTLVVFTGNGIRNFSLGLSALFVALVMTALGVLDLI